MYIKDIILHPLDLKKIIPHFPKSFHTFLYIDDNNVYMLFGDPSAHKFSQSVLEGFAHIEICLSSFISLIPINTFIAQHFLSLLFPLLPLFPLFPLPPLFP